MNWFKRMIWRALFMKQQAYYEDQIHQTNKMLRSTVSNYNLVLAENQKLKKQLDRLKKNEDVNVDKIKASKVKDMDMRYGTRLTYTKQQLVDRATFVRDVQPVELHDI